MDTTSFTITKSQQSIIGVEKNYEIPEVKSIENLRQEILDKLAKKGSGGFWIW